MVMVSVGIVLMFGLAYSMARDNENNSIKTILYMPIRSNRYLLIKMVPYIILGLIQLIISLLIGHFLYKIDYQINIFLLVLIAMLYVLSSISLGLIFGMMKSQISAALLATFVILFPAFDALTYVLASLPKYLMFIQYLIPGKVFSLLLNGMMFGGVIIWWQVIALACQTILFYLIAFLILKRKVLR